MTNNELIHTKPIVTANEMEYDYSANRVLANYFDALIKKTSGVIIETAQDIGIGAQRMMVRISPLVVIYVDPKYAKLLSAHRGMILKEDSRMMLGVVSLATHPTLLYDMVKTIVDYLFARTPEKIQKDFVQRYKELGAQAIDFMADKGIKQATKIALIQAIASLITMRIARSPDVIVSANNLVSGMLTTFQVYSFVDKASISARKIKREERVIYNMLYSKNAEMLYFLVAKKLDPLIVVTKSNDHTNADALILALSNVFYEW